MKRLAQVLKYAALAVYGLCGLALLAFTLPATGLQAKSVITGSMRPAIPPGSLVIIRKTPLTQLTTGDVVTYRKSPGSAVTITHRLVGKTQKAGIPYLITKGDANSSADVGVPGGAIIGKVVWHVPYVGGLATGLRGPAVLLLAVVFPGLVVIWNELNQLRRTLSTPRPGGGDTPARRLEGMATRKLVITLALIPAALLMAGVTWAALCTNTIRISNITLAATATPVPNPAPCLGTIAVQNSGPGSINTVQCSSSATITSTNTNVVIVRNSSMQTTSTGGSNAHNSNTTATTASLANF